MDRIEELTWPELDRSVASELRRHKPALAVGLLLLNIATYTILSYIGLRVASILLWCAIWPIQALLLCGFFGVMHDCVHRAFLRSATANAAIGTILGAIVMINFHAYKSFHLEHHSLTSQDQDPEGRVQFSTLFDYLRYLPSCGLFVGMVRDSVLGLRGQFPSYAKTSILRRGLVRDAYVQMGWIVGIAVLAWHSLRVIGLSYLCPLLLYFPMMGLTSLPEHYGTDRGRSPLVNTRSTVSNRLFSLFFWFNNFHAEHHSFPSIPSYNLPRLNRLIGDQFKYKERSYLRFHARLVRGLLKGKRREQG